MPQLILGVDIGTRGGLALVTALGELVFVAAMPVLNDGPAGRPAVNAPLLSGLLRQWGPTEADVEYVSARPKEAPAGAFAFGRSKGVVEGVLGAHGLPVRFLTLRRGSARSGSGRARRQLFPVCAGLRPALASMWL